VELHAAVMGENDPSLRTDRDIDLVHGLNDVGSRSERFAKANREISRRELNRASIV
jgi:hypothetical protein